MSHAIGGGTRERLLKSHHLPKLREEQQTAQARSTFATRKNTSEDVLYYLITRETSSLRMQLWSMSTGKQSF